MLSSFTLQMPMNVARSATVIATHVLRRACAGFEAVELSADSSGSISIQDGSELACVGVERLFWVVGRPFKVQVVSLAVDGHIIVRFHHLRADGHVVLSQRAFQTMRRRLQAAAALLLAIAPCTGFAQRVDRAEHHEFVTDNFRTESGVVLAKAIIVYGTYGHLDAARDNAVLLPSHYMATHHGYEWLIGPGRALDTTKLYLVATELFGNGHSSSPSNTPEPYHGPRFPVTTIRHNVNAVH